jgi:Uma2 family endonuclease
VRTAIRNRNANNLGELLRRLGVPASRVCLDPPPGKATKNDLVRLDGVEGKYYELVDRTLVEKTMGSPESFLALEIGSILRDYLKASDAGYLYGADALIELIPGLVRGPDVCFISWARRPEGTVPLDPISKEIPSLVVEVLSPSNTRREMARKRSEYFRAGVELVWEIDPATRTAEVFTGPDDSTAIAASGTLNGGAVLPGFKLALAKLFERLEKPDAKKAKKK